MKRKQLGESITYLDHIVKVYYCGPDLLSYVDGKELPNFYLTIKAAIKAG